MPRQMISTSEDREQWAAAAGLRRLPCVDAPILGRADLDVVGGRGHDAEFFHQVWGGEVEPGRPLRVVVWFKHMTEYYERGLRRFSKSFDAAAVAWLSRPVPAFSAHASADDSEAPGRPAVEFRTDQAEAFANFLRCAPEAHSALLRLPAGVAVGVQGRTITAQVKADVDELDNAVRALRDVYHHLPEDLKPERAAPGSWPTPPGSWATPPPATDPVPGIAERLGWQVANDRLPVGPLQLWACGPVPAAQTAPLVGQTRGRTVRALGWTLAAPGLPYPWPFHGALATLDRELPRLLVGESQRTKAPSPERAGSLAFQERWTASGEGRRADVRHLITPAFESAWSNVDPSVHLEVFHRAALCWREGWIDLPGVRLCADAVSSAAATLGD